MAFPCLCHFIFSGVLEAESCIFYSKNTILRLWQEDRISHPHTHDYHFHTIASLPPLKRKNSSVSVYRHHLLQGLCSTDCHLTFIRYLASDSVTLHLRSFHIISILCSEFNTLANLWSPKWYWDNLHSKSSSLFISKFFLIFFTLKTLICLCFICLCVIYFKGRETLIVWETGSNWIHISQMDKRDPSTSVITTSGCTQSGN